MPADDSPGPPPMLSKRLRTYLTALRRWVKAGRPTRTDADVEAILAEHCRPCEQYDAQHQACNECGCRVTAGAVAITNKLRMATETCPLGKWGVDGG